MSSENQLSPGAEETVSPVLKQKIVELFDYRMFPGLLDRMNMDIVQRNTWVEELTGLQAAIYHLDAHLESQWKINEEQRSGGWRSIFERLNHFVKDTALHDQYVKHIRKYEAHELAIRKYLWPTRLDMEYFYFYKSCDVKLLRRIIYEKGRLSSALGPMSKWRYFDLVTEVNDDITDVFEDMPLFNGNRFLIHILQKGMLDAESVFTAFIDQIERAAKQSFETKSKHALDEIILQETCNQCNLTKIKMKEVLDQINPIRLHKESVLGVYLSS